MAGPLPAHLLPDHAAIAESVELAKPSHGHRVVNAVLRRASPPLPTGDVHRFGDLTVDFGRYEADRGGRRVDLRDAGREPMFSRPSSEIGVICSKKRRKSSSSYTRAR